MTGPSASTASKGGEPVVIYSDGACEGNPGPGGWAAVLRRGRARKQLSGGSPATTNNRMELQAAIEALKALRKPSEVEFYTDSQYVRNGITTWLPNWKRRAWRTAGNKPVKNADLWRDLDTASRVHKISWHWVKGHAGNAENERCDELANEEIRKIRRAVGSGDLQRLLRELRDSENHQQALL